MDVDLKKEESVLQRYSGMYRSMFGYKPDTQMVEVVCFRVVVSSEAKSGPPEIFSANSLEEKPTKFQRSFSGGEWRKTGVFRRLRLQSGSRMDGPAIIHDSFSTVYVDFGWKAEVGSQSTLRLTPEKKRRARLVNTEQVELELYSNRFQSLVEEMGFRLRRTAVSTNVKDRQDFSCGLLDACGGLVVNAPHIPVHLGALSECVRSISKSHEWQSGEMIVTNHPAFGGSHLPDVTVVCPVFTEWGELFAFLVNRAHHAEIGGISPGSMPPSATSMAEEGVVIPPIQIMKKKELRLSEVKSLLEGGPYPTRSLAENLSDLKAQVASNLKGLREFQLLLEERGVEEVSSYMVAIQDRAERSVREKLSVLKDGRYAASQKLDDGTVIEMAATVTGESMTIDFSDCGGVHPRNFNATPGIVHSAVIYFLRVWLNETMPLNEGLLRAVRIDIAPGLLNPPFVEDPAQCPPVVAGNVETSQRLVDTLLLAFEVAACSQGTMNNLIFGNDRVSFYETIGGGAGAGEGFHGESGVHVHMTNTGITDPEILEYRYPVILREFSIRAGSGGSGRFRGGNGVVRELEFTESVRLSLLTQHRKEAPYGLHGGEPGKCGEQWLIRRGETPRLLKAIDQVDIQAGDRIRILTPGGGGWGHDPGA